jgi:steroid 5-alpha reductase family enzyme
MFELTAYLLALPALLALMVLAWLLSLARRDAGIVDSFWSLAFLLAGGVYYLSLSEPGPRAGLVLALVAIWALRLSLYVTWRNRGEAEDRRYQAIRARNQPNFEFKSLYLVFGLQGLLAWLISLPLLAAMSGQAPLGWLDATGVALWLVGLVFEAGGDWQLARFKADPANRGKVMDRGLWRYTRHPNYFGDFCIWWGFYLLALAAGGWWSILSPLLMSFFLLKVSGVALLESDISERRPAYRDYIRRTNAFFPGPPGSG